MIRRIFADQALNDPEEFKEHQEFAQQMGGEVVMVDTNGAYVEEKGKVNFDLMEQVNRTRHGLSKGGDC